MKRLSVIFLIIFAAWTHFLVEGADYATPEEVQGRIRDAIVDLKSRKVDKRLTAAQTIQSLSCYAIQAVPELTKSIDDSDPRVRSAIAYTLESIGSPARSAVPALTRALSDGSQEVRAAAAFALGSIGYASRDARPILAKAMEDHSPRVSLAASFATLKLFTHDTGAPSRYSIIASRAVPILFMSLDQNTGFDSIRLARAIGIVDPATGFSVVPRLIALAGLEKNPTVASNASYALRALREPVAAYIPDILRAAQSSSEGERLNGLKEIGWLKVDSPKSIVLLRGALSSNSTSTRVEAATALGRIGPAARSALQDLIKAVHGNSKTVRSAASEAVLSIDPEALDGLMPFLQQRDPKLARRLEITRRLSNL